jgi:hypothetical protein
METAGSSETSCLRYRTLQSPGTEDLKNTFIDHLIFLNKEPPLIPKLIETLGAIFVLFTVAVCPCPVNNCNAFTCLCARPASCTITYILVEIQRATCCGRRCLCADGLSLSAQSVRFPILCAALSTLPDES